MSKDRAERLRQWHEQANDQLHTHVPGRISFMGLDLDIWNDVFPLPASDGGDPFHRAVAAEVRPSDRVLDMGTGSGVSAILAAKVACEVVAVDINPRAVKCAAANAVRNGVGGQITFVQGDVFDAVDGQFDLVVFDPPFRWFAPRDLLEMSHADAGYRTLQSFMLELPKRLNADGRVLINFGSSGDIDYLNELINETGLRKEQTLYGEAMRVGLTTHYYVIRLHLGTTACGASKDPVVHTMRRTPGAINCQKAANTNRARLTANKTGPKQS